MRAWHSCECQQSGVAVLPVAIILLAGAALMLFFSQKNLLVDLQITRNGYVSRIAYAAADSGLALAMSRLNDPEQRKTILADSKGTGAYDRLVSTGFSQNLGEQVDTRVTIKSLSLGGSDVRLQLQGTGCIADCTRGRALVSQTVAMRGGIHRIPFALLSARGAIDVTGPVTLSNQTVTVRGMLLHAGSTIAMDESVQRMTLPGTHPDLAQIGLDKSYAQQSPDQFFQQWFGADKAFIREHATRVTCQSECSGSVAALGSRVIWLEGDARLENGVIGSVNAPVILIAAGNLHIGGSVRITGIAYSMAAQTRVQLAPGLGNLNGAVIAENALVVGQGGALNYNAGVLQRAQSSLGQFVIIPGSWGDGE